MENLLTELAEYLETNSFGTRGTDIFINGFAGSTNNQIAVQGTGGVEPYRDIPIARPTIQISIRNTNYIDGMTIAYGIFNLLDQADDRLELVENGLDIMQVNALSEPNYIGKDTNERYLYTINFVLMLRR